MPDVRGWNVLRASREAIKAHVCIATPAKMSSSFLLKVLSASLCAANRSGSIIREVLKSGQLGIVQKVRNLALI